MNVIEAFSSPIFQTNIGRPMTDLETLCVLKNRETLEPSEKFTNQVSLNTNVLDCVELTEIKQFCVKYLKYFYRVIIGADNTVDFYMTQSWINYQNKNTFVDRHDHPNSTVTGVFYFSADSDHDSIVFLRQKYNRLNFFTQNPSKYYAKELRIPVKTGDLLLFDSELSHEVNAVANENTRISIAFNTFIKGQVGDNTTLYHVKI